MRTKDRIQYKVLFLMYLLVGAMLTGCGKQEMQVTITDGQTKTTVGVTAGETVEKVLEKAEIYVNDKDIIVPDRYTELTQSDKEILISRYAKITVKDGNNITELELTGKTVQDVLNQMGITMDEHDYLNHDMGAGLTNGMDISIVRRMEVIVTVDGETKTCLTKATDVASFLEEQHIAVDKKDRVKPKENTVLHEGTKITVERVSVKEITVREPIAFETKTEYSNTMYFDQSVIKTPGLEGEKEVTYKVIYVDGKEEKREVVSEKVIKEPVEQVITQGTKQRRRIVSKQKVADCDGSGHGYYIITWSDGTVEYQDY